MACIAPPSIWFSTPTVLMISPASTATVNLHTLSCSTASTPATTAQYVELFSYRA